MRLLGLLDLYGINRAVAALRDGTTGAVGLRRNLSGVSGIAEVKRTLGAYFRDQDHVLKARSALEQLRKMGFADGLDGRTAVPGLLAKVEELQLDPLLHPLLELETLHDLCTGRVALPDELDDELRRLLAPSSAAVRLGAETDDPAVLRTRAADMLGAWREFLVTEASPPQARVARVALRSLQLLWEKVGP